MPTMVYKKETISGSPAVTDSVTAGDLRPVTSNAVSGATMDLPYILAASDLNNCYATKNAITTYRTSTNCLNAPVADKNFIVTVHTYNDGTNIRIHQLASFHGAESVDYSYTRTAFGTVASGLTWTKWEKLVTESEIKNKSSSKHLTHSDGYYAKITVKVIVPYTTTVLALMGRGGGLALVGVCANDTSDANLVTYLKNEGQYNNVIFYYKKTGADTIEFYWKQGAYSNRSNYTVLTNPENTILSDTSVTSLPSGTTQL